MKAIHSLPPQHDSLFIISAFLDHFTSSLASHTAQTIGSATLPRSSHSAHAAFGMAAILSVAHKICMSMEVSDSESLECMLETLHHQFGSLDEDYSEVDREWALTMLEHVFGQAADTARAALKEVQSGYPKSRGYFAVWKDAAREIPQNSSASVGGSGYLPCVQEPIAPRFLQ